MYMVARVEDVVRIPPSLFHLPLKEAALRVLRQKYEGRVDRELKAIIITVLNVDVEEMGRIIPGDGGTWHRATFDLLLFRPEQNEVVEGRVVEVVEHGIFVDLGPLDGYIHVSHISQRRVTIDVANGIVIEEGTNRVLRRNDVVRAKVQAVSFRVRPHQRPRVSLTMRGWLLGKLEWIEEELKKSGALPEAKG
ncbi:DNA-directed RNA polymerase [Pyrolobus fumarii 1A]|uniref:DNA-directed RNA polymerase subunit Rpo7 n=1 Tax=Pyrolobus fumarii (strain DSM 11204 / 1A) TaxID=694429 RepID=G0EF81_PYRF1|nr:DNA-directed RNA polymerase [Pyrolobus fumarii 1A]